MSTARVTDTAGSVAAFLAWVDARPPMLYQLSYWPGVRVSITMVCDDRSAADAVVADIPWRDRDPEFQRNGDDSPLFVVYGRAWGGAVSVISCEGDS